MSTKTQYLAPSEQELQHKLSALQYEVTRKNGTEPPFHNEYWNHHEEGIYVDIVTGEPLFSSRDKFDSGTGWPSFTKPIEDGRVKSLSDFSHGRTRTEVRSSAGDSHLGHVFDDGPKPTGLRYCINSAALRFIAVSKLMGEGYAAYAPLFALPSLAQDAKVLNDAASNSCTKPEPGQAAGCEATLEIAYLAGGCFWGMEELLRKIPGVISTDVGYMGGHTEAPSYTQVKTGTTGHAEAVRILFDPNVLSYDTLLEKWFFKMHDPTTKNRQGNDIGTQYRSAIFYVSEKQKELAFDVIKRVDQSKKWNTPVVTEVVSVGIFTLAEAYHQDYLEQNPSGYTCHFMRD